MSRGCRRRDAPVSLIRITGKGEGDEE